MTVTRTTTSRPRLLDVRSTRVRGGVCAAGGQATSTGIGATTITADHACRCAGRTPRHAAWIPSAS
jgi:hypothetical protein